jgi:hypothetical protein
MSRKSTATRKVRRAYSQNALARICTLPETEFGRAFGMQTVQTEQKYRSYRSKYYAEPAEDYYHFRDNGSRVLAVAHLDTVMPGNRRTPHFSKTVNGPLIRSGALDDRLGAYVILDLLPKLGVTCDWLLTVGEESGASTAGHFTPGKEYDHVIEFDRGGTDVVMYQYEDRASRAAVEAAGAVMGHGSFSDIASLEQLGVKAFNWGVGYGGNYHSEAGYAYLNDTFGMVAKYLRFSEQNAGITMPHDSSYYEYDSYGEIDEDCWSCGEKRAVDPGTGYCAHCGACHDCGDTDPDVAAQWDDPDVDVCQCYTPRTRDGSRNYAPATTSGYTGMTWDEYVTRRDEREALDAALADAMARDGGNETVSDWQGKTWDEYKARRRAETDAVIKNHAAGQEAPALDSSGVRQAEGNPDSDPGRADAYAETGDTWTHPAVRQLEDEGGHVTCILAGPDTPGGHAHAGTDGLWVSAHDRRTSQALAILSDRINAG